MSDHFSAADWQWLSDHGTRWLTQLSDDLPPHQAVSQLRKSLSPRQTQLVLATRQLRGRAAAKFPQAEQMFFTELGLQQSTDWTLATYKASRFPHSAQVVDLCTGIGGDLMALARRGPVLGIEKSAAMACVANHNLRTVGNVYGSHVAVADVCELGFRSDCPLHVDPDRRAGGRRSTSLAEHEPPLHSLVEWSRRDAGIAMKLAPGTALTGDLPRTWIDMAEWEWIGHRRECQQLVAWFGPLSRHAGSRCATELDGEGRPHTMVGQPDQRAESATRPSEYVYEPRASVLAAGLAPALAVTQGWCCLTPRGGYLTGTDGTCSPWWSLFRVEVVLPLRRKTVGQWLKQRHFGCSEVKARGVDLSTREWLQALRGSRDVTASLTMLAYRTGNQHRAILARREEGSWHVPQDSTAWQLSPTTP